MPVVLVHGVPETAELWDPLCDHLDRPDVASLQLPGFGCARPEAFGSTKEEYVDWLIGEVAAAGADDPADLVGHDWGGGLVVRLVSSRPELVRSWVTDAAGIATPGFEWHDFAKIWQTPGAGEEFFERQLATPADARGAAFESYGVPAEWARRLGAWADGEMADSILRLYRSAVDVGTEWAPDFVDVPAPGLVLLPSSDPFLSGRLARAGAERSGARVAALDGCGHWWMLQDPAQSAQVLEDFWASVD
jgi:pimeloyl-ACP methyl ester carboxylesterase